jgi:outer membrane lipoprotein-sorting protein
MPARMVAQLALLAILSATVNWAAAEDRKSLPPNAVGAQHGGDWKSVSKEAAVTGEQFDKRQVELVQKVSVYFNQMSDLKGQFVQTSADNKRARGKFYVKRPGRFRFDYAPPSKVVVLSDGEYLAIQDYDLKTDDRFSLDQTPFRVLMRKDVDLLRDARILEVQDVGDVIVLGLEDKNPDNPGRIKLYLAKKPELELKEWVTIDNQGLETRIELVEISKSENLDPGLFKPAPLALEKIKQ